MENRIKELETFLGPRVNYSSNEWPKNHVDKWLMEYLFILKSHHYKNRDWYERWLEQGLITKDLSI